MLELSGVKCDIIFLPLASAFEKPGYVTIGGFMSESYHEVTDVQTLIEIKMFVQNLRFSNDVNERWVLHSAKETSANYEDRGIYPYFVELTYQQYVIRGIIMLPNGLIFLDAASTQLLAQWQFQAMLDAFNAGHHWRYRGL